MKTQFCGIILGIIMASMPSLAVMQEPKTTEYFDVELPFRCSVSDFQEQEVSSTIALDVQDFAIRLPQQTAQLPRYQVNHYTYKRQSVDRVISDLLTDAGIKVMAIPGDYVILPGGSEDGELSDVMEKLAERGGIFYTYDAAKKILHLTHKTRAIVQLPKDKSVMMAVVDAIIGGHFEPLTIDWSNYQITLRLTRADLNKIRKMMAAMIHDKYLLRAEMMLYALTPNMGTTWQRVIQSFGMQQISVHTPGLIGELLLLNPSIDVVHLVSKATQFFHVTPLASGRTIVPSGWRVNFNFGECAIDKPYTDLTLIMRSTIRGKNDAQTVVTLDSLGGELASFDFTAALDQQAVMFGIPVQGSNNEELLMTLKFDFINLIKKGEQNG